MPNAMQPGVGTHCNADHQRLRALALSGAELRLALGRAQQARYILRHDRRIIHRRVHLQQAHLVMLLSYVQD